jgi:hypothetical protein
MNMVEVIYDGHACEDCTMLIANGDDSGIADPMRKYQEIAHVGLGKLGHVVMACDDDCEGEFRSDDCDYCGTTLAGVCHPIVVLA